MKNIIRTFLVVVVCLGVVVTPVKAQTPTPVPFIVPPGGIAIIGFDFVNDKFTIVCLSQIPANTTILFTDNGWNSNNNTFRTGEGVNYWDAPNGCELGKVITLDFSVLYRYKTYSDMSLAELGDQIFVYQEKSDGNPRFIFGLNTRGTDWTNATNANTSALPAELASLNPSPSISVPQSPYAVYSKLKRDFDSTTAALAYLTDLTNWTTSPTTLLMPTGDFSFTTTAVHMSDFRAETGGETAPWWVLVGLVVVPVVVMVFNRPKKDCCK